MHILVLSLVFLYAGCLAFLVVGIRKAPPGYEDEQGFHLLKPTPPRIWRAWEASKKRTILSLLKLRALPTAAAH